GKQVLTGDAISHVHLWDAETGKKTQSFSGGKEPVIPITLPCQYAAWGPNGNVVSISTQPNTLILWNAEPGEQVHAFTAPMGQIRCVNFSPDGKRLLVGTGDGILWLFDVATGKALCQFGCNNLGTEWIVATPEGFYDCSKDGMNLIAFRRVGT